MDVIYLQPTRDDAVGSGIESATEGSQLRTLRAHKRLNNILMLTLRSRHLLVVMVACLGSTAAASSAQADTATNTPTTTVESGTNSRSIVAEVDLSNCRGIAPRSPERTVDLSDRSAPPSARRQSMPDEGQTPPSAAAIGVKWTSPSAVSIDARQSTRAIQLLGQASIADEFVVDFMHYAECDGVRDVKVELRGRGAAVLMSLGGSIQEIPVAEPWAVDRAGKDVPTWFEVEGSHLRQVIDARGATLPVTFDPTYSLLYCQGHFTQANAAWFLDIFGTTDNGFCPPYEMFHAANGHFPVWAYETNVANDYGWVIVRQGGECNYIFDTGPSYDFQVPCKAHDYCYDLRRASLSATVTDADCDGWFYWLMEAHCNNRTFPLNVDCRFTRDLAFQAVSQSFVVTNPSPGAVELVNRQTLRCADVEGPSYADVPIQQWACVNVPQQEYKIWPAPGRPGYFRIISEFSGKCIARSFTVVVQRSCNGTDQQTFAIQGALNQDMYSFRDYQSGLQNCMRVPFMHTDGLNLDHPVCNDYDHWYLWRIYDAAY